MFRCCCHDREHSALDLAPSYASVLVLGTDVPDTLLNKVDDSETRLTPWVSAWCHEHRQVSMLVTHARDFPCDSAFLAHQWTLEKNVMQYAEMRAA
jgi:hypothetical protein